MPRAAGDCWPRFQLPPRLQMAAGALHADRRLPLLLVPPADAPPAALQAYPQAAPPVQALRGAGGRAWARSHSRFVPPLTRFIPYSLRYSVPLFLKRQCDRTLGRAREPSGGPAEQHPEHGGRAARPRLPRQHHLGVLRDEALAELAVDESVIDH
jgi:hypothetical protein